MNLDLTTDSRKQPATATGVTRKMMLECPGMSETEA